jgi:hypothetical protein
MDDVLYYVGNGIGDGNGNGQGEILRRENIEVEIDGRLLEITQLVRDIWYMIGASQSTQL